MLTSRLDPMDAQRYDPLIRGSQSSISIMTNASAGHGEAIQEPDLWANYGITPYNSPISSLTDLSLRTSESPVNSYTTTSPFSLSATSFTLEGMATHGGNEEEVITSTCTIIRPMPRSPIMEFFSRPSSPFSRPSSPTSRPASPITFSTLNCFGSTDAFEDEVDYFQAQRAKELEGQSTIQICVEKETAVQNEELWRDAVQVLLYGNHIQPRGAQVSVGWD